MQSTNLKLFHIIQLEDLSSNEFKTLHLSGSFEDGLARNLKQIKTIFF